MDPDAHERALAARIAAGEVSAYAALLELYWEPLVRYATRTLTSGDAAEDAVQQAFIRLWEHRAKLKPTQSPRAYLYRLVHNLAIDELRRRGTRERFARISVEPAGPPTPADYVEGDELGAAARRAIEALPERRGGRQRPASLRVDRVHGGAPAADTYDKVVLETVQRNAVLTAMLAYLAAADPERVPRDRVPLPPDASGQPQSYAMKRRRTLLRAGRSRQRRLEFERLFKRALLGAVRVRPRGPHNGGSASSAASTARAAVIRSSTSRSSTSTYPSYSASLRR